MELIIEYWPLIIISVAAMSIGYSLAVKFLEFPTSTKLTKVKEWLLYAVVEAEKELGAGTGKIKLRYVYNLFLTKFPTLSKVITFEEFSNLVDETLDKFKEMLETNEKVKEYVEG